MSGTIFFICLKSAISAWPAARKRWRKGYQNRKEKQGSWQRQNRLWNLSSLVSTNSSTVQSRIASKSLWILKAPCQNDWTSTGGPGAREFNQDAASSSHRVANRCSSGWKCEETRRDRRRPRTPEFPWILQKYEETRRIRKLRHQRQRQILATQFPYIYRLRTAHGEWFSRLWDKDMVSVRETKMENLDVNAAIWWNFMSVTFQAAVHLGTDFTENLRPTKNQTKKSLRQLFHVTWKLVTDQTEITGILLRLIGSSPCGERDGPADWQGCSVCNRKNLRRFWLSAMSGRYQSTTSWSMGK